MRRHEGSQRAASGPAGSSGHADRWHHQPPQQPRAGDKARTVWAKPEKMASFKAQMETERHTAMMTAQEEYLGRHPENVALFEATVVVPGKHMLPRGLDDAAAWNDLRTKFKVWVTRVQPNVFEIRSKSITRLQDAVREMNWTIHDMRLSSENLAIRFLVQMPSNADYGAPVSVRLNSRPRAATIGSPDNALPVALDCFHQLRGSLAPSTYVLRALGPGLKMRVNFGRFEVRQRKRGVGDEMTYTDFASMVAQYSKRGGASIHTRLFDVANAHKVVQRLLDPAVGICTTPLYALRRQWTVLVKLKDTELAATAQSLWERETHLSSPQMRRLETLPRLNWTVAAPDMQLDWNLQVDYCEKTACIPSKFRSLIESIKLSANAGADDSLLQPPRVVVTPRPGGDEVEETVLKSSVMIPFKDTPFIVEVSVSHTWARAETRAVPETRWGMEFYGLHWDETINHISPNERREDWDAVLQKLWPVEMPDQEAGFMDFIEHVVEVQSALASLDLDSTVLRQA